jgi:hypothetical protein
MAITDYVTVEEVGKEEGFRILDEAARRWLDISADEFLRRWDAGEYAGKADTPSIMNVAPLIPLAR